MNTGECIQIAAKIAKLFPSANSEQIAVMSKRLPELRIDYEQALAALNEEMLNPTTAKVGKVAAIWARLKRIGSSANLPGAADWKPPNTFGEVLQAQQKSGERPASLVQKYILGLQAKCRERMGEAYATDHALKQWTIWRSDLADAGMTLADAESWLVGNTEVEQAWVDALEAKYAAGRARQAARMARMRDGFAPSLPAARKAPGFYTRGEPQIGAA